MVSQGTVTAVALGAAGALLAGVAAARFGFPVSLGAAQAGQASVSDPNGMEEPEPQHPASTPNVDPMPIQDTGPSSTADTPQPVIDRFDRAVSSGSDPTEVVDRINRAASPQPIKLHPYYGSGDGD